MGLLIDWEGDSLDDEDIHVTKTVGCIDAVFGNNKDVAAADANGEGDPDSMIDIMGGIDAGIWDSEDDAAAADTNDEGDPDSMIDTMGCIDAVVEDSEVDTTAAVNNDGEETMGSINAIIGNNEDHAAAASSTDEAYPNLVTFDPIAANKTWTTIGAEGRIHMSKHLRLRGVGLREFRCRIVSMDEFIDARGIMSAEEGQTFALEVRGAALDNFEYVVVILGGEDSRQLMYPLRTRDRETYPAWLAESEQAFCWTRILNVYNKTGIPITELRLVMYEDAAPRQLELSTLALPTNAFRVQGNLFAFEQPVLGHTYTSLVMTVADWARRTPKRYRAQIEWLDED